MFSSDLYLMALLRTNSFAFDTDQAQLARSSSSVLSQIQQEWGDASATASSRTPRDLVQLNLRKRAAARNRATCEDDGMPVRSMTTAPTRSTWADGADLPWRVATAPAIASADKVSMADLRPLLTTSLASAAKNSLLRVESQRPAEPLDDDAPLKLRLDPALIDGRLANGVRYLVRPNSQPSQEVQLRVFVDAGSLNEDESERGLAHVVEHCVFRGTKSFGDGEIDAFMAAIGCTPGADNNAYTSADCTTYEFNVPWRSANAGEGWTAVQAYIVMAHIVMAYN